MNAYFYILHCEKLDRFYSGITTLSPEERLENHINKVYSKRNFSQKVDVWILF
ncbi:GIY-YIG nuclease family protein [Belliella marina]|uniref:GIY-YIG nuclease family protein n=1 Tax=Belliella marina TaxID=1644146 RepID=A0ABW4VRX1_9BACT